MTLALSGIQGAGLGVRMPHVPALLDEPIAGLWLELLLDNWLYDGAVPSRLLSALAERYPLTAHGVGLSLASLGPLDMGYLAKVKKTLQRCGAIVYSEHLSFSHLQNADGKSQHIPDLLPLPFTEQALKHISMRIQQVQDYLGRKMLIENISAYIEFKESELSEGEFLTELVKRTGCGILLDVNNLYVNEVNLGRNAQDVIDALPTDAVHEIHLAGYEQKEGFLLDAHNNTVSDAVWKLYQKALSRFGPVPTLIEWDNDLPELAVLLAEAKKANIMMKNLRFAA